MNQHGAPKSKVDFGTTDEWVEDLQDIFDYEDGSEGFLSTREICRKTGFCKDKVLGILHTAEKEGRLEIKQRVSQNIAQRRQVIPVYRIQKSKPKHSS